MHFQFASICIDISYTHFTKCSYNSAATAERECHNEKERRCQECAGSCEYTKVRTVNIYNCSNQYFNTDIEINY